ncbi:hypothetical protein JW823_04700 [bacterium]|nr:hypothetical protein [candidate division CSSED10-310 bacterium]
MVNANRNRRTRNLVDHRIQFGFARIVISYLALYSLFLVLMFALPIGYILHYTEGGQTDKMEAIGRFIMGDATFWGLLIIFIIVLAVHSVIMTQRFAGPIFVFRRHLTRLKNGELSRIQLRNKDHLQDVKLLLNEHIDQLEEHMLSLGTCIEALESHAKELASTGCDPSHISTEINRLKEIKEKGWFYSP